MALRPDRPTGTLFTIDIAAFVVLGLLQAVVTEPWQLMVVRLLLGVAVGAEYALGAALLSEFAPANGRGRRLAGMLVTWYGGYLVSVVVAYALVEFGGLSWRWVLATSVVPALITLAARFGLPESPRWLMHHGRVDEARAIADRYLGGDDYFREEELDEQEHDKARAGGLKRLFEPGMRGRTLFVCAFYACNITPCSRSSLSRRRSSPHCRSTTRRPSAILANAIAVVGALVGMLTIERVGRRQQLIGPFWVMAAALLVVGLWASAPSGIIVACFAVFAFTNALQGDLTAVYPAEVFPTELRSTGIGFSTAFSRIGAASGTFLLPVGISTIGIGPCMLIAAAICLIGGTVSQLMAPETTGLSLSRTAALARYRVTARCSTWASWCCAASSIDRRNVGVNVCLTRGRRPGR